ncbi:gamma-butyrobetaine hydroxylase-like domain-containing protein [Ottowia pentelensis]|uniref:Gamma-butyrobetaine hydroxylase-like domain-containing protein n=1 Tax=Ottowia pentelensis TaxID=511108 RepID=A0ABV6PWS6_9BURK
MSTSPSSPVAQKSASAPPPEAITIHAKSRVLELVWADGTAYRLPFELMRVYSPSAEVQGHGPGQAVLQTGKRDIDITALAPVGNYAVQPRFSDGHESGIFTWEYLRHLGANQQALWRDYEARLAAAGRDRDTPMPTLGKAPAQPMTFHAKRPH